MCFSHYCNRHKLSTLTMMRICLHHLPTALNQNNQSLATLPFYVTPTSQTLVNKYRNINLLSIAYVFLPQLRSDLPWTDSPGPGTLGFTAGRILTFLIATHVTIISCVTSSTPCRYAFISKHNALLPFLTNPQFRYIALAPLHRRRRNTSLVSYYAFFKGWLLLSQPPRCLSISTSFST